jgi:hypothetical protein
LRFHAPRDPARPRDPLGECLDLQKPLSSIACSELAPELSDEILSGAVVVCEVPGREPGVVIGEHLGHRARGLDVAMRAGDLPHAVENAAYAEIRSEWGSDSMRVVPFFLSAVQPGILALEATIAKFTARPVGPDSVLRWHSLERHKRGRDP